MDEGRRSCKKFISVKVVIRGIAALVTVAVATIAVWQHWKVLEECTTLSSKFHLMAGRVEEISQRLQKVELTEKDPAQKENPDGIPFTVPVLNVQAVAHDDWRDRSTSVPLGESEDAVAPDPDAPERSRSPADDTSLAALVTKLDQLERLVTFITTGNIFRKVFHCFRILRDVHSVSFVSSCHGSFFRSKKFCGSVRT